MRVTHTQTRERVSINKRNTQVNASYIDYTRTNRDKNNVKKKKREKKTYATIER